jgi:NTP pyrophosphatase (non-canonical NTP hydrolase)
MNARQYDKQEAASVAQNLSPMAALTLTLNEYQTRIAVFDFPDPAKGPTDPIDGRYPLWYYALGLTGEAGETADKIKKVYRNDAGTVTPTAQMALAFELGDVLWYLSRAAAKIGITLGDVALMNITKLSDRASRDVLRSSGDSR